MARGISREPLRTSLVLGLALAGAAAAFAGEPIGAPPVDAPIVAQLPFDEGEASDGSGSLLVFASPHGRAALSRELSLAGPSSMELVNAPEDHDFPEFQGRFPRASSGVVFAHFGLLTARPFEPWNVALAGPAGFRNAKDGIAFRLEASNGFLHHHSDSIPKKLFALEAYRWYVVDLVYRVDAGTYDLTIREEGRKEPLVTLADQLNATSSPGSSLELFSFAGDVTGGESAADLFVDEVAVRWACPPPAARQ